MQTPSLASLVLASIQPSWLPTGWKCFAVTSAGAKAVRWSSDGSGQYEISEAEGVQEGTKIVLTLKPDCSDFADGDFVGKVIEKYSNFVGSAIYLNGRQVNTLQ
ncbi:hypothetical protein HPB49_011687 [Dermacentor silvarum]|uniref:Uncharacterized protein n=1 Tax=Dermacentor silvarum TaxID=543639 RepID=A0ACB8CEW7_DERSI|nr:hypothetical protein HPB49_011687 [Dermacentor silvarum]